MPEVETEDTGNVGHLEMETAARHERQGIVRVPSPWRQRTLVTMLHVVNTELPTKGPRFKSW